MSNRRIWIGITALLLAVGIGAQGFLPHRRAAFRSSGIATVIELDGADDFVSVGDISSVDLGISSFSVSCFIKADSVAARQVIVGKDSDASGGRQFALIIANTGVSGSLTFFWCPSDASDRTGTTGAVISAGAWTHIVAQRTGSTTLEIWVNGVSQSLTMTGGASGAMQAGVADLCLGKRTYSGFNDPYDGQLSDVRIYNRALSGAEVASLAASHSTDVVVSSGLIHRWMLNDVPDGTSGDGDTFVDSAGSSNGTGSDGANNSGLTGRAETF